MFIIRNRKIFYVISAILVIGSIITLMVFGLNYGIDFKGGSIMEVSYPLGRPSVEDVNATLSSAGFAGFSVRPTGDNGFIIRTLHLEESQRQALVGALEEGGKRPLEQKRFDSIGPTLGAELQSKALISIILVILVIVLFIAFVFRKVSEPVSSWKYGAVAVVALVHDVIIPTGAFALLGHFFGAEADALFVTALLVVLGFSVHDTIVVFDRVRENLRRNIEYRHKETFEETVGRSVGQTFTRSINTSLSVLFSLVVLYFFGSESTRWFSLALIIGIAAGTYSSIFIGSPLLVTVQKWQEKKALK
ncbi:MAG: protein translocase subunit SecF [bacterium]|nr:protein translocase subunit SecF [bacterium]